MYIYVYMYIYTYCSKHSTYDVLDKFTINKKCLHVLYTDDI